MHEIEKELCLLNSIDSFEQLNMGPILKHPLVLKFFLPPSTLIAVPEVTTVDVIHALHEYRKFNHGKVGVCFFSLSIIIHIYLFVLRFLTS